jgi:cellulose synthase (UDP-forming)
MVLLPTFSATQKQLSLTMPHPPSNAEKDIYLGRQHRWLQVVQLLAFSGVGVSLYGFSRMSYWTLIFMLPLLLFAVEMVVSGRTSTYRRRLTLVDHRAVVDLWSPDSYPSVDVLLPSAGEPLDLLSNTYSHVAALQWPGRLRTYVLDDSARPEVKALAADYGFTYLARPTREFKKAGNLRHGFERSYGDFITILDADFVPRTDFLAELVPYFDAPNVGIVQSPQHFATDRSMGWLERTAGATQELFYRFIQPARDAVGAAICVGTSAVYRRAAVEAIGGFPQTTHSEDVFTGVEMAKVGYELQYVPVVVSTGTCPSGLNTFITQQYRWCEGSMALAADPDFHRETTMTLRQRLCFWSGFLYYFSTAINAFMAPLPVVIMVWLLPEHIFAANMLPLAGSLILWLVIYPLVFRGGWRIDVLRAQMIYSFAHALAIFDVVRGRTAEWIPTGTDQSTPLAVTVRRVATYYLLASQVALFVGLALDTQKYGLERYWSTVLFAVINAYVFLPVVWLGLQGERDEAAKPARRHPMVPA